MQQQLEHHLSSWPSVIIADKDIYCFFDKYSEKAKSDLIRRAVSWGWLRRIKRGLFVIGPPFQKEKPSRYELAQHIYGPSYISLESALSYYQMIPEAVYATVSASAKRDNEFDTPIGQFLFHHVPTQNFYDGVHRVKEGKSTYLMASPLKALGDYIYVNKKEYSSVKDLESDLRIDTEQLAEQPIELLNVLKDNYPSKRVQKFYKLLKKELYK